MLFKIQKCTKLSQTDLLQLNICFKKSSYKDSQIDLILECGMLVNRFSKCFNFFLQSLVF